jgi:hypothetical protein
LSENVKERDTQRDIGVKGGNIMMYLKEGESESVDCIELARDRDQWQAPVNKAKNLSNS